MRKFNLKEAYNEVITNSNIISLISKIHESTSSSNKIEGIYTTDKRIEEIVTRKIEPKNRNEEEIAGYRDVLTLIHENYEYIDINKNIILQLHRDLYKYTGYSYGGKFKNSQNYIEETDNLGNKRIRFMPVSPVETPIAVESLCQSYNEIINNESYDPLILIPIFILDFLSIHPFNDGNGRISRLLTLLLLYKTNYMIGKYISIEKIIEDTKDSYYEVLEKSSINWHDNQNDYSYFIEYYLGVLLNAYKELDSRVNIIQNQKLLAYDRIINVFKENIIPIDKAFIMNNLPDLSETTIERNLNILLKENKITKLVGGRYTKYKWNSSK